MYICIHIYYTGKHFQFIPIRSCTKMPTLPTLCIMGKLDCMSEVFHIVFSVCFELVNVDNLLIVRMFLPQLQQLTFILHTSNTGSVATSYRHFNFSSQVFGKISSVGNVVQFWTFQTFGDRTSPNGTFFAV